VKRTYWSIIVALCASVFLPHCAGPPAKQPLVFTDPQTEEQAKRLQSQLQTKPNDVESRMELGKIYLSEYMIPEAIGEFERVLKIDPNHIQAYLLLSLTIQKCPEPNLPRAAKLLGKASELAPDNADVHLNLAQVYDKQEQDEKAIREFERAIELSDDPATLVSAHLGLMAIHKKRGESEKADEHYDAAYEIYPGVQEMIKQAEIDRVTPAPKYAGEEFRAEDGFHPSLERRIEHARKEISEISGKTK